MLCVCVCVCECACIHVYICITTQSAILVSYHTTRLCWDFCHIMRMTNQNVVSSYNRLLYSQLSSNQM